LPVLASYRACIHFSNKLAHKNMPRINFPAASLARLSFLAVAIGFCHPGHAAGETAMFRGDSAHSGQYDSVVSAKLKVKWSFQTGEAIVSSPTLADGIVYVGSSDNFLYAIDAATGKQGWKFDAHGNVSSSPAISNHIVYVVSLDGNLYAIDAASGAQKWAFATQGEKRHTAAGINYAAPATEIMPDPWDLFLSSPAVADGVVYFGSGDNFVYAVEAETGKLRWKFETGGVVHASPAVAGGLVYVGSFDSYFYALNALTGELAWKFKTGSDDRSHLMTGIPGSASVSNGTVYFGSRDANVYALDAKTGGLHWKFSASGSWVISSPAVLDGRIYFTTSDSLKFHALDAATGAEVYSLPTNIYAFSSPALAGGHAFFGTFDGKLHDVDLHKQSYVSDFTTPGYALNGPRYLNPDGKLKSSEVWTGDTLDDAIVGLRTKIFSMGSILSSPVIRDGVVYFGSADGTLYALGL
jgi:eukaryotic-like serine/threonine-protein kinase